VQDYLAAVHDRLNKQEMADEARDEAEAMRMSKRFDVYDNLVEIARVACLDQHHRLVNLQTKAAVARNDSTQLHERYKARFLPFTHPSRCHFFCGLFSCSFTPCSSWTREAPRNRPICTSGAMARAFLSTALKLYSPRMQSWRECL
jgi:hypothetical protein